MQSRGFLRRLYLPLLLALCVAYAFRPIGPGYDFWAHAAVGRWIWDHKQWPTEGLFLWGSEPTPWVAHSWLCQLFFYGMLQGGGGWTPQRAISVGTGPIVVVIVTTLVVCAVFALIWNLWRRSSDVPVAFFTPILFALGIWSGAPRYQPRQEMFSALFVTVLLYFLVQRRHQDTEPQPKKTLLLSAIFAIWFALWVNMHALVALGLIFLWITAIGDVVQDRVQGRFDARTKQLLILAVVASLATLLNPYGIDYWTAADQLKPGNMANYIDEWKPPLWAENLWPYVGIEVSLGLIGLFAWLLNPQRRWAHAVWVVVMTVLLLRQRRHLWMLAIMCLIVMAANSGVFDTQRMWRWWRRVTGQSKEDDVSGDEGIPIPMRRIAQIGTVCILAIWAASSWPIWMTASGVSKQVPEHQAYVLEQGQASGQLPKGNLVNDYAWSSYLQWRLNRAEPHGDVPSRGLNPLYLDLLNAYPDGPDGLLQEYFFVLGAKPAALDLMKRRGVNLILLPEEFKKNKNVQLFRYLEKHPEEWRVVDADKNATLWVRRKLVPVPKRSVIFDGVTAEERK